MTESLSHCSCYGPFEENDRPTEFYTLQEAVDYANDYDSFRGSINPYTEFICREFMKFEGVI